MHRRKVIHIDCDMLLEVITRILGIGSAMIFLYLAIRLIMEVI